MVSREVTDSKSSTINSPDCVYKRVTVLGETVVGGHYQYGPIGQVGRVICQSPPAGVYPRLIREFLWGRACQNVQAGTYPDILIYTSRRSAVVFVAKRPSKVDTRD